MFEQVKLDYAFAALEPYIDALTMETHYSKHHATYTKNFNAAVEAAGIAGKSAEQILSSLGEVKDEASRKALRNNGGGYYNHNLYFEIMSPEKHSAPEGKLAAAIEKQFGSGWAWLSANKDGELQVSASANQDNPLMEGKGFVPILGIDVWEHAYYLKYKNLRPDYVKAFFEVLDWKKVSEKYEAVLA